MFLDRLLWCEDCRRKARARAAWWGWLGGLVFAGGVAVYVFLVIRPTLIIGAWIATVVAAVWLGQKVAREFAYGVMRYRNARAVEAVPPVDPGPAAGEPDPDASSLGAPDETSPEWGGPDTGGLDEGDSDGGSSGSSPTPPDRSRDQ